MSSVLSIGLTSDRFDLPQSIVRNHDKSRGDLSVEEVCMKEVVRLDVEIVHRIVTVTLEHVAGNRKQFDLVYDDVFSRLDQLIDAGMVAWIRSRPDYFTVMPQRDVDVMELETEIKKRLRV